MDFDADALRSGFAAAGSLERQLRAEAATGDDVTLAACGLNSPEEEEPLGTLTRNALAAAVARLAATNIITARSSSSPEQSHGRRSASPTPLAPHSTASARLSSTRLCGC
jgi:hypothetical protein